MNPFRTAVLDSRPAAVMALGTRGMPKGIPSVVIGANHHRPNPQAQSKCQPSRCAGSIPRGASLTTESHSGRILITVPPDADAGFFVSNFQGKITNDLSAARPRPERTRGGQELSFELGSGGSDITIRNFKGDVALKRRK